MTISKEDLAPVEGHEQLVVVSKVKQYVKARRGLNTSDAVAVVLTGIIEAVLDQAIVAAVNDGRKTVLDRDVKVTAL